MRSRSNLFVAAFVVIQLFAVAGLARAQLQSAPVDLQVFRPAIDSKGFTTLNASQILAPGDLSFGLVTTWGRNVLKLNGGPNESFTVQNLITPTLTGAVGIFSQKQIGLE